MTIIINRIIIIILLQDKDIEKIISCSGKVRFELKHDKIRALYGHSSNMLTKVKKGTSKPPSILYHGTCSPVIKNIMSEGNDKLYYWMAS
jgi:putative RNA 2'-phosphotransferase